MTPNDIEALANALVPHGIAVCEVHDDKRGLVVSLRLGAAASGMPAQNFRTAATSEAIATPSASRVLRSPGMGRFAARHPLLDGLGATFGQPVVPGQVVGYLLAGSLISEVTASQAAVLGRQLVEEGELLGYGDAVFELL